MGVQNACCFCPEAWAGLVNQWVTVYTVNDNQAFFKLAWQVIGVQPRFITARRWTMDLGWQQVVIPCHQIVALVDALPDPPPVNAV